MPKELNLTKEFHNEVIQQNNNFKLEQQEQKAFMKIGEVMRKYNSKKKEQEE